MNWKMGGSTQSNNGATGANEKTEAIQKFGEMQKVTLEKVRGLGRSQGL